MGAGRVVPRVLQVPEGVGTMVASIAPSRALEVAGHIEELITSERLVPGDRIATKEEIRARSGAARATVNEAVKLLQERGRVSLRPGPKGGLFVASTDPGVQLGRFLLAVGKDAKAVTDAMALRDFLEEMVLAEAAEHRSEDDLADLREHVAALERADGDVPALVEAIWALHGRIADVTPNATLRATYRGLVTFIRSSVHGQGSSSATGSTAFTQERIDVHAEMVEVIASGDGGRVSDVIARHHAL